MKTLVVYYSFTGSNKYLAEKIAHILKSDCEAIRPRLNVFPLLMLFSLVKTGLGIMSIKHSVNEYDRVVVCGPIWMGRLISPLHDFITKYRKHIKSLYFVTCCGSSDAAKNDKFGYAGLFQQLKNMLGDTCIHCEAFPIGLVVPLDKKEDGSAVMKTHLSDENFTGEIQTRLDKFITLCGNR
jgi:hypothetical protein